MSGKTWSHKDVWRMRSKDFLVEVSRHSSGETNFWCVYVYIYPEHPYAEKIIGDDQWQSATEEMPLHGGCTYLTRHIKSDGTLTSIQIGCDYAHCGDERFEHYTTKDDAGSVFFDAERLFDWMIEQGTDHAPT